jgi:hypothetical protein
LGGPVHLVECFRCFLFPALGGRYGLSLLYVSSVLSLAPTCHVLVTRFFITPASPKKIAAMGDRTFTDSINQVGRINVCQSLG